MQPPSALFDGVTVDHVTFQYFSGLTAIQDINLSIPKGSSLGIVGPSGCGKSTLLQILAGTFKPTSGSVTWPSVTTETHPQTMVFQSDTLLPWLTAAQNAALYYRLHRIPHKDYRERVDHLLDMVGLRGFENSYPYQLSGGMKRRVALLAAVAPNPATLLLDEPFSALDEPTRVAIHQDVLRIMNEARMTVVLVTHDLAEAISLCDEVVILSAGPGKVVSRHKISFPRDRRNPFELRQSKEFLDLYGTLWHELSEQIVRSNKQGHGL